MQELHCGARLKSKQVSHFRDDSNGHNAVKLVTEKELARLVVIGVAVVKQRDQGPGVNGDALFHE